MEHEQKLQLSDPVYTVPDPHAHDIKLNGFKTSVVPKSMIILQNLITTNHRKSGKSKDDLKLTELDVVTMRIRYRVNGVSFSVGTGLHTLNYLCRNGRTLR